MKKFLIATICIALILCTVSACSKNEEYEFTPTAADGIAVVSFNCASPWGNFFKGTYTSSRVKRFAAYMNTVKPDSIGTQEMNGDWTQKLGELMSDYDSYGVIRGGDKNEKTSEMNSVFWLKDKYDCIEQDTFWLSQTPESESKYEGAGCYRVCSYVVLQNKQTGEIYIHMNTHLDHVSDEAREFGAQVVMDRAAELQEKYANTLLVLTGDFNDTVESLPYNLITQTLEDSFYTLSGNQGERRSTYNEWGELEDSGEPIDFIFTNSHSLDYRVLDSTSNGYISDHYGVYSVIERL